MQRVYRKRKINQCISAEICNSIKHSPSAVSVASFAAAFQKYAPSLPRKTHHTSHEGILDGNRRRKRNQCGDFLLFSFRRLCRCETNTEFLFDEPIVSQTARRLNPPIYFPLTLYKIFFQYYYDKISVTLRFIFIMLFRLQKCFLLQ